MARGFAMLTGRPQAVKLHPIVDPYNAALSLWEAYLQRTPLVVSSSYVRRLGHPSGERHPPRDHRAVRRLIHPRRYPDRGRGQGGGWRVRALPRGKLPRPGRRGRCESRLTDPVSSSRGLRHQGRGKRRRPAHNRSGTRCLSAGGRDREGEFSGRVSPYHRIIACSWARHQPAMGSGPSPE